MPTTRPLHRLPKDRTFYVRRDYDLVVIGGGPVDLSQPARQDGTRQAS